MQYTDEQRAGFQLGMEALRECKTREDVEDLMRTAGITGPRIDPYRCPIAKFLSSCAGASVSVGSWEAGLANSNEYPESTMPLPLSVRQFIYAHDAGDLPEFQS